MSLVEHLQELRSRLAKALLAVIAGGIVGYVFFPSIFLVIQHPFCTLPASERALPGACRFVFTGPLDAFVVRLKVSLIVGLILASPVWLYQLWRFITPALHRNERRWAVAFVGSATILFAGGCVLGYYVLGKALRFLLGIGGSGLAALPDITRYLTYFEKMILIFGLSFELPLVLIMLNLAGVVPATRLRKWRRWAIFLIFIFAGVATPTQDAFTMLALALPMVLLYEVAVFVARLHDRRHPPSPYAGLDPDEASPLPEHLGV